VEHLRFPPAGGGEQRTALLATIQVASRSVTVAATHLSNKQGHYVGQLRELQQLAGSRAAPRVLVGDLNMPLDGAAGGLPAGLAGDGAGPDLAEFRPDQPRPAPSSAADDRRLTRSDSTTASSAPRSGAVGSAKPVRL